MNSKVDMNSASHKQALITGASSGIGYALCIQYAALGYAVYACGRNLARLTTLTNQYTNIKPLVFDITDEQQVNQAFAGLSQLDLVILNAGDCEYIDDASQFDAQLFKRVITTNLIATGYLLAASIPLMAKGGQLVLVSSSVTYLPLPRAEAYGASKAAMTYLAKTLSIDLAKQGILVSVIEPGFVKTPLTDKNNFSMPFMISAEQAAIRIVQGLALKQRVIHFPKRFTYLLKILSLLPFSIWQKIAVRTIKK